jgi:hypothetical protein
LPDVPGGQWYAPRCAPLLLPDLLLAVFAILPPPGELRCSQPQIYSSALPPALSRDVGARPWFCGIPATVASLSSYRAGSQAETPRDTPGTGFPRCGSCWSFSLLPRRLLSAGPAPRGCGVGLSPSGETTYPSDPVR